MGMDNIMKVRSLVFRYARKFLDSKGFYEITLPLITMAVVKQVPICLR